MKYIFLILLFFPNLIIGQDYHNFYGISWRGNEHDNLKYAKQMGYDCVFYQRGMEYDSCSNGLYFYIETPEYFIYDRLVNYNRLYSKKKRLFYENYCALKGDKGIFPYNLAPGWFFSDSTFSAQLDFGKRIVVLWAVRQIINKVEDIQKINSKFHFAGFAWDVPNLSGDFWNKRQSRGGKQVSFSFWNYENSKLKSLPNLYSSYEEGRIQFYKLLFKEAEKINSNVHFCFEPSHIYDDWMMPLLECRNEFKEILPRMIVSQESSDPSFIYDKRILKDSLIRKEQLMISTPNCLDYYSNLKIAALTAVNGLWFNWFGRFGGSGNMPDFKSIKEVPAYLKLIRVLADWENLNSIPLIARKWNNQEYSSTDAIVNSNFIFLKQPKRNKIFLLFNTLNSKIKVPLFMKIREIHSTNKLCIESANEGGKEVKLLNGYLVGDSSSIGKCFILDYDVLNE